MRIDRLAALAPEVEGARSESKQSVLQQAPEMRSVEGNLFENTYRERR
jgi:hypothetical protein